MTAQLAQIGDLRPDSGSSRRGSHRLGTWHDCPQKFAYRYLLRLIPLREPRGRALGSMVHLGTMYWDLLVLGRSDVDPIEAMRCAPERIAYTFEAAREILEAYKNAPRAWKILDVEREFEVKAGGHAHTQRFDRTILRAGRACIVDLKTTSGDVRTHSKEWARSLQFLSAEVVGRATFPDVYDVPYGGVLIYSISTREPGQFDEKALMIEPLMVVAAPRTIAETNAEIAQALQSDRDPWKYKRTFKCRDRYGDCEYLPLCERGKAALGEYVEAEDVESEIER